MTPKHSFSHAFPGDWRLFGEIELPTGTAANDHINAWLVKTLRPLNLNGRFLDKILASAALAASGDPAAHEAAQGHMHVLVYMPEDSPSNGQSWGFFRVEKRGDPQSADHDHAIAFYLYREGM